MNDSLRLPLRPHGLSGRLIVFEGADGSGKTTLAGAALGLARSMGRRVVQVEVLDDFIRYSPMMRRYAHHPSDPQLSVDILALSLACAGSRLQNARGGVLPELARGSWVFCDRYAFTTWAEFVNLRGPGKDREVLRDVLSLFPRPDLAFLAFAAAETCVSRVRGRPEESDRVFDIDHNRRLIATYRRVGVAHGFTELSTQDRPRNECEAQIGSALLQLDRGSKDGATERSALSRDSRR